MKDAKVAAKNLYKEDFIEVNKRVVIDNNASKRSVAECVFNHTFDCLNSEEVAKLVFDAYERRRTGNSKVDFVHMSTALASAVMFIRGEDESN